MSPFEKEAQFTREDSLLSLNEAGVLAEQILSQGRKTVVRFGEIHIREYNRVLGDHPDTRVGPPISLGWEYNILDAQTIDGYEKSRSPKKSYLRLNSITRKNMLKNEFGVPEEEIKNAEKEIQKIKQQREKSAAQGKSGQRVELVVETAKRKFFSGKRVFKALSLVSGGVPFMSSPSVAATV